MKPRKKKQFSKFQMSNLYGTFYPISNSKNVIYLFVLLLGECKLVGWRGGLPSCLTEAQEHNEKQHFVETGHHEQPKPLEVVQWTPLRSFSTASKADWCRQLCSASLYKAYLALVIGWHCKSHWPGDGWYPFIGEYFTSNILADLESEMLGRYYVRELGVFQLIFLLR